MTKTEAKERISKLKKEIEHHRYLYHVLDQQEISEAALDSLKHELWELEQKFPEFITPDSPSQRVAGKPLDKFAKVRHRLPMLSLVDAFAFEELQDWEIRNKKIISGDYDYYVEIKMDGLAIELIYEDGFLKQGSTRGDGLIGEDVTQNLKTIEAIPLRLCGPYPKYLEVRGEVYMTKKVFSELNKKLSKEEQLANPRNAAAGAVRQFDAKITASRRLDFMAYDIVNDLGQKTHEKTHQLLTEFGFKSNRLNEYCRNLEEVEKYHAKIGQRREKLPYLTDGIVVNVNNLKLAKSLGVVGKAPRSALAYKYPGEQATTIVEDIQVQVGRTGALTPVAHLRPVRLAGSTISRATLHNEDEIKRLDVRVGDTVIIQKAGDVIPDVVKVLKNLRPKNSQPYIFPKKCPDCGAKVERKPGEVAYYCSNKNCFAQQREKLYHFVSKKAFDIEHLGPKIIDQLLNEGLISSAADIFKLTQGDLEPLERFAEKSAQNLVEAIHKAKTISLAKFIFALGIRHVGEETAIDLANHFNSLDRLRHASLDEINNLYEIGDVVAESVYDFFQNKKNLKLIDDLLKTGIKISEVYSRRTNPKIAGKTFILTGTLETMTREAAKEKIRSLGGNISSSVSKNTDYLLVGKDPGSKYSQAKALDIKILTEKEFLSFVKNYGIPVSKRSDNPC